ncbi:MAG: electron transfer flavoprotein subunit beta/FixA family protein [Thermoanaerobacteraceae bacterium]|nr:electron transfer flavoprotein subunit beta/FixA family protein [Thermoanaerobacteraceae bacterium]
MNILVCLKQTFDTEAKIELKDGEISTQGIKYIVNPYDEFAVEEALKLKEAHGGEVTVISVGPERVQEALRQALAMGADKAVLIETEQDDAYATAKLLAKAIEGMDYDLILGGQVAIDDNSSQVATRLAEELDLPQVTIVTKLDIDGDKAICTREIEGGSQIVETSLPAVITAQKGLNEPRYPSLKGIMQAKKKELKKITPEELGVEVESKVETLEVFLPPKKEAGKIIEGEAEEAARELVRLLKEEAKVV